MTKDLVEHIATEVKTVVSGFNCLLNVARKFDDQPVILDGRYAGMQDGDRVSGYIRFREDNNDHQYQNIEDSGARKIMSCGTDRQYIIAVALRMVIVHRFKDEAGFEASVIKKLIETDFGTDFSERDIRIVLENSTTSKEFIYFEELGEKEENDQRVPPSHVNLLMVDFSLGYRTDFCETVNFDSNECL